MPEWLLGWDGLRILNVALAMVTVSLLVTAGVVRWRIMPFPLRRLYPWIVATYVVIAYGSGEALADDVRPGVRVILMCLCLIGMVIAGLFNLHHGGYDPPTHRGFIEHHKPRGRRDG